MTFSGPYCDDKDTKNLRNGPLTIINKPAHFKRKSPKTGSFVSLDRLQRGFDDSLHCKTGDMPGI